MNHGRRRYDGLPDEVHDYPVDRREMLPAVKIERRQKICR